MNMKPYILYIIISLIAVNSLSAQDYVKEKTATATPQLKKTPKKKELIDRLTFGGNFGAAFGDVTFIDISPTVGYHVTDDFILGTGFTYSYLKDKRYSPIYQTNIFGGRLFAQYIILENFVAHAEYELLNMDIFINNFSNGIVRDNIHSLFIGGGYRGSMGGNSFVSLLILYNINESEFSPYQNPQIRAGFGIGL
jgi:hypothetical protein